MSDKLDNLCRHLAHFFEADEDNLPAYIATDTIREAIETFQIEHKQTVVVADETDVETDCSGVVEALLLKYDD